MIMRKTQLNWFICLLVIVLPNLISTHAKNPRTFDDLDSWKQAIVSIERESHSKKEFKVLLAESNKHRRQGLMHIEKMQMNQGMIFVFKPPRKVSMWMRNTKLSLDMIFIDRNNKIVRIVKNTTPFSTKGISSEKVIQWVLEINGGLTDQMNIENGDHVNIRTIKGLDEG